jgi:hypothetical protein
MLSLPVIVLRYGEIFVATVSLISLVDQSAVAGLVLAHYCQASGWFLVVPLTMFRCVSVVSTLVPLL